MSVIRSPPWKAYAVSHQTQRSGQPVRRTNVHGSPAQVDSPWIDWKISVIRRNGSLAAAAGRRRTHRQAPRPSLPPGHRKPSGDSFTTLPAMNSTFAGRSASRRIRYGYQCVPKGM